MATMNTYFDFQDFSNPVHYYIDNTFFWAIVPGLTKKSDIYIKRSFVTLTDDIVQILTETKSDFYQIENYDDSIEQENSDGTIIGTYFRLDSNYDTYERQVYSFWDFLGAIGGLNESLIIIGGLATYFFTERLFFASVIQKIYQVS